jgi:hypothetical protein
LALHLTPLELMDHLAALVPPPRAKRQSSPTDQIIVETFITERRFMLF